MSQSVRKIVGICLIVLLVIFYALIATTIATIHLASSAWYVHLAYFLFTGVLWIVPVMYLIKWMSRPD